jgi:hypothetical protein
MTVYNHFPTEYELIEACSTHWSQLNPLSDPECWAPIRDPEGAPRRRSARALCLVFADEDMMGKVLRDARSFPRSAS